MKKMVDETSVILEQYDLTPEYVETLSNKVKKVYTSSGPYVLKKLSKKRNTRFTELINSVDEKGYVGYVPIFQNKNRELFTPHYNDLYYLMPWLPNEPEGEKDERHQYLFREVAELHRRTVREVKLTGQEATIHYDAIVKGWEEGKEFFEKYVDECEKQLYLAPFELQTLTYYIEASRAAEFSRKKLDEWSERMKEKEATRLVVNHGRLSAHHFLYDEQGTGFFTNFEQARLSSPIDDMLIFFKKTLRGYPKQCNDCVNWFYTYQKSFPFSEEEMLLFLSYLSYPDRIVRVLKNNAGKDRTLGELNRNQELLKAYWQFKNVEYFVMKVSEIEEKKKLEQQQKEEAQSS
ncbi:spore coat protein YsxE [Metabacillus herbersteinensis]|uniref:Spore coat protein YsxE n=1 Tax=Metabacillus herbersteinensis TaxID=283816 RepID=A0ABV6G930_9BACI